VKSKRNIEEVCVIYVHTSEETLNYSVSLSSEELASVKFVSVAYY